MFMRLARATRLRAAATLALAYALCVLAPPVALAFMDGDAAVHCLATGHEHHAGAQIHDAKAHVHEAKARAGHAAVHVHEDGAAHQHDNHSNSGKAEADGQTAAANCCGFSCLSAMPISPAPDIAVTARLLSMVTTADHDIIIGRGPGRIDRPPNVLLPH